MFQSTVYRSYPAGLVGDLAKDGPNRSIVGNIQTPDATNTAPNRLGRVFVFATSSDLSPNPDVNNTAFNQQVIVGLNGAVGGGAAQVFAGIAFNRNRYALYGTTSGGPLAPSIDLPNNSEVELNQMGYLFVDVGNPSASAQSFELNTSLYYFNGGATTGYAARTSADIGRIFGFTPAMITANAVPAGFTAIPNSALVNASPNVAAATSSNEGSFVTVIKLTN